MLKPPSATCPVIPSVGAVAPVAASAVRISSGFWHIRQELNTTKLLDHCDTWIESMGWYDTFRRAAGQTPDKALQGKLFTDADVYKLLEAFAWETAVRPDPDPVRERRLAELSALVAATQEDDGYLNTFFGPRGTRSAVHRPGARARALLRRAPVPGRCGTVEGGRRGRPDAHRDPPR